MPYPNTRLTRNMRLAIMIFLIVLFFTISPLVILYTAGYRYDISTGKIQETGVISIDIEPEDATVKLNGVTIHKRMPIRLANRAPGWYKLTIEKDGYHTLEKDIEVTSKQTTYIRDVPLFKHALPLAVFPETQSTSTIIRISHDGKYSLRATPDLDKKRNIITLSDISAQQLISEFTLPTHQLPYIEWGPVSDVGMVITSAEDGTASYTLIDASRDGKSVMYTNSNTSSPSYQWHIPRSNSPLYIHDTTRIFSLSLDGATAHDITTNTTWYVDDQKNTWQLDAENRLLARTKNNTVQRAWTFSETILDLVHLRTDNVIARTPQGIAVGIFRDNTLSFTQLPTDRIRYNPRRNEWISWSNSEIWRIDNQGESALLTRLGLPILEVYPMDDFGTLLVDTGNSLLGFHPQFLSLQLLYDRGPVTSLGIDQKTRNIYFLGDVGHQHNVFELAY